MEIGETLFKYTLRNGKFFVHEGEVIELHGHKTVYFNNSKSRAACPREAEFGVVRSDGPSLLLHERDDELAKHLFIEYEEECISDLQEQIRKKLELINALK